MIGLADFKRFGILGMNRRNSRYTLVQNPRRLYPLVDDKLKTKALLESHELPTPPHYFSITRNFEIKFLRQLKHLSEFVIKPARGTEGRGILVIVDRVDGKWKKSSGELLSAEDIEYHAANILAGLYSLGGVTDQAFLEFRVRSHSVFRAVAYRGAPDIRMILYRGVPVMSMLRIPTKASDGRANLHQGAVGAGIDMAQGVTLGGVLRNRFVDIHPDTRARIGGIEIPFWNDILEIAVKTYPVFKLGYFGIDFVIDQILGPLILELNARPGLSIQLANRKGLRKRLDQVDSFGAHPEQMSWQDRLELSRRLNSLRNSGLDFHL